AARIDALVPHKVDPGSRPSSIVLFEQLDPATLGRLIALYEHSVLTQSVVWGVNAFDQWGVELGKKLTTQLAPAVQEPAAGHAAPPAVLKLLGIIESWRRG
ncbi:MAG TPA: glucose-6-phosphate isomerase, partial [Candidatus Krumholzibacteria bacterium]|nr:glucose-6-phosphate isomerase [Candidatus Krumholzibacteria bacterium]